MLTKTILDYVPLWVLVLLMVALVLLCIEGGYYLAVYRKRHSKEFVDAPISSVIGGTLGLLAFMLSFTFGMAASRFDTRRELLLDEVNAIGTCYLRAGLVSEPQSSEIRRLLREYVHIRADVMKHPDQLDQVIARSETIHDELWSHATIIGKKDPASEMNSLFIDSLNSVIDFHTKRVVVGHYQIPNVIWIALYIVSGLSMAAVGYQFGRVGTRDMAISLLMALAFSIVIGLIADLDCSTQGILQVSQGPMIDLDKKINGPAPAQNAPPSSSPAK